MRQDALKYINQTILRQASRLDYIVKDAAPSTEVELFNSPSLIVWSGQSDKTVFQDETVNFAFRALHDALHLKTGLNFTHDAEIELGRIQASKYDSDLLRELVFCEVSIQAMYHKETGLFLQDQASFTENFLKNVKVLK
jgi:hypothetical protein